MRNNTAIPSIDLRGRKNQAGFSLIEIMIALVIVAIIAAVAVPSYQNQVERGRLSECASFAMQLASLQEQYYTRNQTFAGSITAAGGLNTTATSENGYCTAALATVGGSCDPDDASERCVGFTLSVSRNNIPDSMIQCETLTLDNRGQKGVSTSSGTAGAVNDCWH